MAERVTLYNHVPPPGENIPVDIKPFMVDDLVPEEGEIEWAVKRLRNNPFRGASRMRAEHKKGWLAVAWRAEKEENAAEGEKRATSTDTGSPEDPATQGGGGATGRGSWTLSRRHSGRERLRRRRCGRR